MKSTICHDFPSPDLLEGPKDGKIKENGKFLVVHVTTDHEVTVISNQLIRPFLLIMRQENNV